MTDTLSAAQVSLEKRCCAQDPAYFIHNYVKVRADGGNAYVPFRLWPSQLEILDGLLAHKQAVLLKARRLGITSVVMGYAMWVARFIPNSNILLFSVGQRESMDLIRDFARMMYFQLPPWLRCGVTVDRSSRFELANGSRFIAFGSKKSGGDSYASHLSIIDECDLIDDLDTLMGGVIPATERGQIVLLSRPDKSKPESRFKRIFRAAHAGENNYWAKFLPWWAKPGRTREFYDARARDAASTDWMWEQYPATIEEALAPRQESKRIPLKWLEQCHRPEPFHTDGPVAGLPGVRVFRDPAPGRRYVLGADPAGGKNNPNTDYSVAQVLDAESYEQVAVLASKVEPSVFGDYLDQIARHYHHAGILVESNNHGGTVLGYLRNNCPGALILRGPKGEEGFTTTDKTQILRYDLAAELLRQSRPLIHDGPTFHELASIETATLKAPEGLHDDLADAWTIALWACSQRPPKFEAGVLDLSGRPTQREEVDAGITYVPILDHYAATVAVAVGGKDTVVKLGGFPSLDEARYAQSLARHLLGMGDEPDAGEVPDAKRVRVQVAGKLRQAGITT